MFKMIEIRIENIRTKQDTLKQIMHVLKRTKQNLENWGKKNTHPQQIKKLNELNSKLELKGEASIRANWLKQTVG